MLKRFGYKAMVAFLVFVSYRMYISNFFYEIFNMEEFIPAEAIKLLFPYSAINTIIFFLIVWYVNKETWNLFASKLEKGLSFLFSFLFLAGFNITTTEAFTENMHSARMLIFYAVFLAGTYYIFRFLLMHLKGIAAFIGRSRIQYMFSEKKQFILFTVIFVICWLPYAFLRYPAGFEHDAYYQIADFLEGTMTNHWPVASSVSMGIFVRIGQMLFGSPDIGIFIYCVLQTVIGALIFSYETVVMRRFEVPALFTYISALIFAIVPVYPGYITSVVKDAPFACMVLLFVLLIFQEVLSEGSKAAVFMIVTGFMVCILRNNGIFIVSVLSVVLSVISLNKRRFFKKKLLISLLATMVLFALYSKVLLPVLGIQGTSESEAFSVPFQQTARLASIRRERISDSDAVIINDVLDFERISSEYDQWLSDPVKATYRGEKDSLGRYFGVWLKEGIQNPDVYLDAFLFNSIGFIYPDVRMGISPVVSGMYGQVWNTRDVQFTISDQMYKLREKIKENVSAFENLPIIFPFVNVAIQLWIPVALLFWSFSKKKYKYAFLLIPSLIGVLVCLASPTYMNNGARYALPVIYTNMLLIGIAITNSFEKEKQ